MEGRKASGPEQCSDGELNCKGPGQMAGTLFSGKLRGRGADQSAGPDAGSGEIPFPKVPLDKTGKATYNTTVKDVEGKKDGDSRLQRAGGRCEPVGELRE